MNETKNKPRRDLATLYDCLFESLDKLRESTPAALASAIQRAAAVRQTATVIIDAAKLEVAVHKLKKESALDGLFPNLDGMKQLGAGGDGKAGNRDQSPQQTKIVCRGPRQGVGNSRQFSVHSSPSQSRGLTEN